MTDGHWFAIVRSSLGRRLELTASASCALISVGGPPGGSANCELRRTNDRRHQTPPPA